MSKRTYARVPIIRLTVDPTVQRTLNQARVEAWAKNFNEDAMGVVTISHRDNGDWVIIDGQHRVAAARRAKPTDYEVEAHVYTGLTLADEAVLFNILNSGKAPSVHTKHRIAVIGGDSLAVAVEEVAKRHGWKIDPVPAKATIAAISTLYSLFRRSSHATDQALMVLTAAWEHDYDSVRSPVLRGVAELFIRYDSAVEPARLVAVLRGWEKGLLGLSGEASALTGIYKGSAWKAYGRRIHEEYNRGLKARALPPWK